MRQERLGNPTIRNADAGPLCAGSGHALQTIHGAQGAAPLRRYIGDRYRGEMMERADSAVLGYVAVLLLLILAGIFLIPY